MNLRVAGIVNDSVVDGPGLRLSVFAQGCSHNCKGCHNPNTHDLEGGYIIDTSEIAAMAYKNPLLSGVTFSGGEPFLQTEAFKELAELCKVKNLTIIAYTGFLWEDIIIDKKKRRLLECVDYLVDGKFAEELRTLDIAFVGSSNQRIIDVKKSFELNQVVEISFF